MIGRAAYLALHLQQLAEPPALLLLGNRVGHFRRLCSLARAVDEREQRIVLHLADKAERLLEVLVRLAGEADDDVGGQRYVRDMLLRVVYQLQVVLPGVAAVHQLQYTAAAALHRKVEVPRYLFALGDGVDELVSSVLRVAGHVAYLELPGYRVYAPQKLREINVGAPAVAVYVLTQQQKLLVAVCNELLRLADYLLRVAGALPAAYVRHYAVGAEVVAAVHYRNARLEFALPAKRYPLGDNAVHLRY